MNNKLKKYDLELFDAINEEMIRERSTLEMIASENFTSQSVLDVVGSGCTPEGENFVRVLAEYGRISLVPSIARVFEEERAAHEGRSDVTVISAFELTADQENQISSAMAGRLGTDVTLAVEVDSSLIGGVVIRAGDLVIDASLRGRLNQLSQTLA